MSQPASNCPNCGATIRFRFSSAVQTVCEFCKSILDKAPGFRLAVEDGPIRLEHIFLAGLWSAKRDPHDIVTLTYRRLIDVAEAANTEVEGELCMA